jgi:hypothetical protein
MKTGMGWGWKLAGIGLAILAGSGCAGALIGAACIVVFAPEWLKLLAIPALGVGIAIGGVAWSTVQSVTEEM